MTAVKHQLKHIRAKCVAPTTKASTKHLLKRQVSPIVSLLVPLPQCTADESCSGLQSATRPANGPNKHYN